MPHGEIIRRATILLHSSNAEYGAGLQQHFKRGTLRDMVAKMDFFRRVELATVDDFRKVRKT
jgi:hypothetical protein